MDNFRSNLIQLTNQISRNPFIELQRDYIGGPTNDQVYKTLTEHYRLAISDKLFDLYHLMSSCEIEWTCDLNKHADIRKFNADDTIINGVIHVRPVGKLLPFDNKLEADWWTANLSAAELEDLHQFRYFDFNDDYIRVGFVIQGQTIPDHPMYFIMQRSTGFSPLDLSFEEYLDKIIEYKGFQGWPFNYLFQDTENYQRMMFYLNQLF